MYDGPFAAPGREWREYRGWTPEQIYTHTHMRAHTQIKIEKLGILIPKKATQYDQWCEKGPLVRVWLHFGSTFS